MAGTVLLEGSEIANIMMNLLISEQIDNPRCYIWGDISEYPQRQSASVSIPVNRCRDQSFSGDF